MQNAAPVPPVLPSLVDGVPAADRSRDIEADQSKVVANGIAPEPEPNRLSGGVSDRSRGRSREAAAGMRPTVPVPPAREPRRTGLYVVALFIVAILVGGVAVAAYMLRDRPEQVTAAARPEVVADPTPGKVVNRVDGSAGAPTAGEPQPDSSATPAGQPETSTMSPASPTTPNPADASSSGSPDVPAPIALGSEHAVKGPKTSPSPLAEASPPAGTSDETAPAASGQGDGAPPTDTPVIGVSQRAGLLVDAPDDPQKVKTFPGSVVWRIDSVSAGQGQPLSNAVRADIDVPEAKLSVSMVIKKNFEPQFPASHTIEFHFTEQPGNSLGAVKQINVPELRRDDASPTGDPLTGVSVTITDDYFLVGLSRGDAEANNIQLMMQRNWFDVSLQLASGKIAKVAFEKGPTGEKILADAIASWR